MEAILPLQTATIAFEVGKGIVQKSRSDKYEKHFMRRVVKALEKNCINVCDPQCDEFESQYAKMHYHIAPEIGVSKPRAKPVPTRGQNHSKQGVAKKNREGRARTP